MKPSLLLISLFFFNSASSITRYVTPSGAGLQNGTNWANAFPGTSLQTAINASAPGDEVWVAAGTYFTTTLASRSIYFSMLNGIAIYGSFNGTETVLSQRIFTCGFSSILSAEIGVPGNADNSYHVISNSSLNNTAILDGFTITGGNANFDVAGNDSRSHGGGIMNLASNGGTCSPTIRNCLFTGNTAVFGGGMFNNGFNTGNANPVITNCIFYQNAATLGGGGMDNFGYSGNASPSLTNCIFYNNTAVQRAGAMYCWGGGNGNASPVILNSVFVNNSSADGGAFISDRTNTGGGSSGTANPAIRNSILWGNTASGTGPQFFILGAASFSVTYSVIDITGQNPPHTISGLGTGNLFAAPAFFNIADANGIDNCWLTVDDGLQLQTGSVGLDAGDNTGVPVTDIRNYNRIVNSVVDMGAYEFASVVLPVRLLSFHGRAEKEKNVLIWSTASETNNLQFEIERSNDGSLFERIGTVSAAGNGNIIHHYNFTDSNLSAGKYYYRLRQKDTDGRHSFSNIILLADSRGAITVYPNPASGIVSVLFNSPVKNETYFLLNSNGQTIQRATFNGTTGAINLAANPAGIYYLVNADSGTATAVYKTRNE